MNCPHCGVLYRNDRAHVCADRERWTREERDEWRVWARRQSPALVFVGTYSADRFGGR